MKPAIMAQWALALLPVVAASGSSGLAVRSALGTSAHDTIVRVARALHLMARNEHTVFENSTEIARSYEDAILLKLDHSIDYKNKAGNGTIEAGIEVVCANCYIIAKATATLTIEEAEIDWSGAIGNFSEAVFDEFGNFTDVTFEWMKDVAGAAWDVVEALFDGDDSTDASDIDFPTLDVDFNIELPTDILPETNLRVQFDELEVYLDIGLSINAGVTYTIPLLPPQAHPIGLAKSSDLFIGTVISLDLILEASGSVELNTGLHILLDKGAALEIALFGENFTNTEFKGGKVEFLPVTVRSGELNLFAVLKVAILTGFNLDIPHVPSILENWAPKAGIAASMFANIAEFDTNISGEIGGEDEEGCFGIEQDFRFAVGAAAGATVEIRGETWGPSPNTTIDLWSTRIGDGCAKSAPANVVATTTAAVQDKRQDMSTATLKSTLQYTGVVCLSNMAECPASLQKHTVATSVTTLTSVLPSGETPAWPTTAADIVASKVKFGAQAKSLFAAKGSPTPGMGNDNDSIINKAADKLRGVDKHVIIGVSVGAGVLLLIIIGGVVFCCIKKRRTHQAVPGAKEPMIARSGVNGDSSYYGAGYGSGGYGAPLSSPATGSTGKPEMEVSYHAQ